MKPSDDLFHLIASMSRAEKRLFMIDANKFMDGKKKYIALFEAMQKIDEYDEEEVKKYLSPEVRNENFASLKNRLWQRLKDFLREKGIEDSLEGKGFSLVETADILQKRGLIKAAKRELKSAEKLADKLDLIDLKLQANEVRRNLVVRYQRKKIRETIEQLQQDRNQLLQIKLEEEAQKEVYYQLAVLMRKDFELRPDANREVAERFLQDEVLAYDTRPRTFLGMRMQMMSRSFCYHALRRLHDEYLEYEGIMDLWDRHPVHQKELSNYYRLALSNYLHISAQAGKYDRFPFILDQLEGLPVNNEDEEIEAFSLAGHYRLLLFMNQKDIDAAKRWIDRMSDRFDRFGAKITPSTRIGMLINFTLVSFFDEDNRATMKWIEQIYRESSDHRVDLQGFARILELLVMADEHNAKGVESRAKSAQEWLRSKRRLLPFENTVLNSLRTMGANPVGDWPQFYLKLKVKLEAMQKEKGNLQGLEEVRLWCEARLAKVSMKNMLQTGVVG